MFRILVINPGSTSTAIALFENEEEKLRKKLEHSPEELKKFSHYLEQVDFRKSIIIETLKEWGIKKGELDAVSGRGGPIKSLESGTYKINNKMLEDIKARRVKAEHISNIGPLLAHEVAKEYGAHAFTADPVSVDEFEPLARVSGFPEFERDALQHTLNIKAMVRRAAKEFNKTIEELNFVVAHIGGGISVCPVKKGRIIDANNANDEGPFSPERCGTLPVTKLVKLCFSGKYDERTLLRKLIGGSGLTGYLGTNSLKEIEKRINENDERAKFYLEAMAYQIAKEIGAMSTVLMGDVDAIILTGGGAKCKMLMDMIIDRVKFIAPIKIYPGEHEMLALAQAALRVLRGEENPKEYL